MVDQYIFTNIGGYEVNEDCVDSAVSENGAIFVLADGLGSYGGGDTASQTIVHSLTESFTGDISEKTPEWLCDKITSANDALFRVQSEKNSTMKSTVVALIIENDKAVWANVGDSRLYYIHNNAIAAVTKDHSVAYKKYISGEITREQIAHDEDQPCLLRSLGNKECCAIDSYENEFPLSDTDAFLLCSDGFWENVRDEEILFDYLKADTAQMWAENLLLKVKMRMPKDNDNLSFICTMVHKVKE